MQSTLLSDERHLLNSVPPVRAFTALGARRAVSAVHAVSAVSVTGRRSRAGT